MNIDLTSIKSIHFVGIKGVGMTALALWAKKRGYTITGSDIDEIFPTDLLLKKFSIPIKVEFKASHINNVDLVIVTGAHNGLHNIEAAEAKKRGIPTLLYGEALGLVMDQYRGIAVSGCHGKTTTSAMITHILRHGGMDPSFAVGCGEIPSLGTSGWAGMGEYFIGEADEYINGPPLDKRAKFLFLHPEIAVITNIEYDHPDAFTSLQEVENAYLAFTNNVSRAGLIIAGIDSFSVRNIISLIKRPIVSFGTDNNADVRIDDFSYTSGELHFSIFPRGENKVPIVLSIPGEHNAKNAAAAATAARFVGVPWKMIRQSLSTFRGTKRRFEFIQKKENVLYYDDYAHHPTEIRATLDGARAFYPKARIITIFQPHTFSRTQALLEDFVRSFKFSDIVIITDIYASAREAFDATITGNSLAQKMRSFHKHVKYLGSKNQVVEYIQKEARPGDLILTMGAGNINLWHKDFVA